MSRRRQLVFALAAASILGPLTFSSNASYAAAAGTHIELLVMHATNTDGGGGIDARIGDLPHLRRPPFSSYNTYTFIERKDLPARKDTPAATQLVNGQTLRVTLKDVTSENPARYRYLAERSDGSGGYVTLLDVTVKPNQPNFVAGLAYPQHDGVLVLAFTVRP